MTDEGQPNLPAPGSGDPTELLLYQTADGRTKIEVRLVGETLWLTQGQMAELFQTTPKNIKLNLKERYEEGEVQEEATCKHYLQVQSEAGRQGGEPQSSSHGTLWRGRSVASSWGFLGTRPLMV